MTNDEFCRIMREFDGEPMDNVGQLAHIQFTGEELKEFCDHVEQQVKNCLIADVVSMCCDETRKVNQFLKRPSKYCMTCSKELN